MTDTKAKYPFLREKKEVNNKVTDKVIIIIPFSNCAGVGCPVPPEKSLVPKLTTTASGTHEEKSHSWFGVTEVSPIVRFQ